MIDAPPGAWTYPYQPHERQCAFHACTAEEVLYGGAAGGGKSDALLAAGVTLCLMVPGAKVILFRRTFPELEQEIIPRMLSRLQGVARYKSQDHVFLFPNGATFRLGYLERDQDVTRYQGPEYQLVLWDELTHFTRKQYTYMRSRLRMAGDVADQMRRHGWIPRMMAGTNPGGPGHGWVKAMFVDPSPGRDYLFLGGIEKGQSTKGLRVLAYIPAKATDNPHLDIVSYTRNLESLDPVLARALRDGDWDILDGVRWPQFRRGVHVIEPEQLPVALAGYPLAMGVDYGLSDPFAAYWGALLPDNLVVVYRELYKAGLTAEQQAQLIRDVEAQGERALDRPVPVALDPSCWNRQSEGVIKPVDPDAPAEGSIAWFYRKHLGGSVVKARNDRVAGWQLFDHHLRVRDDGLPRLLIYSTCTNLIRTLPEQLRSTSNPEDINTHGEDHAVDALRYLLFKLVGGLNERAAPGGGPVSAAPVTSTLTGAAF